MTTETVAKLIVNQIPLGQLKTLLSHAGHPNAMGDGCGGGCGGGAGCMDPHGLTGITDAEIKAAFKDKAALSKAVGVQLKAVAQHF